MRNPIGGFENVQSQGGMSTVGQLSNIEHSLGTEMATMAGRAMALRKANQYQNEAREALAKNKVPPSAGGFGQIGQAVSQIGGTIGSLAKQFGIGATAPGSSPFSSPVWQQGQQDFQDFYQNDAIGGMDLGSFGVGDAWDSGVGSLGTSGMNFFGS